MEPQFAFVKHVAMRHHHCHDSACMNGTHGNILSVAFRDLLRRDLANLTDDHHTIFSVSLRDLHINQQADGSANSFLTLYSMQDD